VETTHRCPGEPATIDLMKAAVLLLATSMDYDVPPQDLRIDLARMPARPESGFVMSGVRPREARPAAGGWAEPGGAPLH
jgi:fatty-acid peroxygenase